MQAVSLLTIELQLILRVDGSNNYHFFKKSYKKNLKKSYLFLKAGLKSSCGGSLVFRKWELPEIRGIYMGKPEILAEKLQGRI